MNNEIDTHKVISIKDMMDARLPNKTANCEKHGDFERQNIIREIWTGCPVCSKEHKAIAEKEQAEKEVQDRHARWIRKMGEAGIPERFRYRTLASYIAINDGQKRALSFMTDYIEQFALVSKTGRSAILCGKPGTGKTHLAIGVALHVIELGKAAAFTSVQRIILRVKDSWRKDSAESETDVLNMLVYPDLLIIDEIGVQFGSEFEKNFMFLLLNERYEKHRPTILLSNLTVYEIKAFLGERIYDRLREDGGQCVSFDWESHRGAILQTKVV